MPTSGNVFWKGKDISSLRNWFKTRFKGKGVLSAEIDPLISIGKNALLELKTEMKGNGVIITGGGQRPGKNYHFKPGTVLQYTSMRSRGDFFLKVVKLNAGRDNQFTVGDSINSNWFGPMENIDGTRRSAIGEHWGNMYVLRKYIHVKNPGKGSGGNFDPGL